MWPDGGTGVFYRLIPGFTGYAVGDDGSVWSRYTRGKVFKPGWRRVSVYRRPYGARYCVVCLRANNGKGKVVCRYVHRLVLTAFVGPPPHPGLQSCHGDGDTFNNRLGNLRWDTPQGNGCDAVSKRSKLTTDAVVTILLTNTPAKVLAARYGVAVRTVHSVRQRVTWRHVRFADE